jgi:hypothetical protein
VKTFFCLVFGFTAGYVTAYLMHEVQSPRRRGADWLVDDIERRFESLEVEPS